VLKIKFILCPIDFSEFSVRAYFHALSLAEHYQAKLVVQHVVEIWRHPSVSFATSVKIHDEFCEMLRERANEQLLEFVRNHTHSKIQPDLVVNRGMTPDLILSFAEAEKTDLIVMGSHGRRGYDRLMLGSVTDRVMRRAPCPVLAVCNAQEDPVPASKEPGHVHQFGRILFCTDFSEDSKRALNYAISMTQEYDADLTLLHVLDETLSPAKAEEAVARALKRLDELISPEVRKTLRAKTAVRSGKPYRQIIKLALEERSDMVAMGVRGGGALDSSVFGSTTYRVMQLGCCPVLAVHA
jgi:nucleotide-binding universal stress UspA family protein